MCKKIDILKKLHVYLVIFVNSLSHLEINLKSSIRKMLKKLFKDSLKELPLRLVLSQIDIFLLVILCFVSFYAKL